MIENNQQMKKNLVFLLLILFASCIIFSSFHYSPAGILTTGAPPGHTGAPGEETCARAGCHDSNSPNTGSALLSVTINNSNNEYIPGNTYNVTVSVAQPDIYRFGFEFTALKSGDSLAVGTIILTDNVRTQKMIGTNQYTGREYVTYNYAGTSPVSSGKGEWTFQWIAPQQNTGNVVFYVAAVSANNDATDGGDQTYTTSLMLQPAVTTLLTQNKTNGTNFRVFPNSMTSEERFSVSYFLSESANTEIALLDMNGRRVELLFSQNENSGSKNHLVAISKNISAGIFLIELRKGNNLLYQKVTVQK